MTASWISGVNDSSMNEHHLLVHTCDVVKSGNPTTKPTKTTPNLFGTDGWDLWEN